MHLAGSGRVIIQLSEKVAEGQILCDDKGTRVAKVMELIGPVKRPFASGTPLTNNIKKYIGKSVFASKDPPVNTQKIRRRKK
ncbi:MAG: H/ACA ribonucleoprotein complex subunit GAR1 [Candidatus Nitrosomaritimum yanchengensis]